MACGALDARAQVRWAGCAHTTFFVELVERLVFFFEQSREFGLQRVEHQLQIGARHAAVDPLVDHVQADRLGPEEIVVAQFTPEQALGAGLDGLEMAARLLAHGEGDARGENLVFHHIVAEQLEAAIERKLLGGGAGESRRGLGAGGRVGPELGQPLEPIAFVSVVGHPRFAIGLHFAGRGRLVGQVGGELLQLCTERRQSGDQSLGKALAAVVGQALIGGGRRRIFHRYLIMCGEGLWVYPHRLVGDPVRCLSPLILYQE